MGNYGKIIELGLTVTTIIAAGLGCVISFLKGRPKRGWKKGPPPKRGSR